MKRPKKGLNSTYYVNVNQNDVYIMCKVSMSAFYSVTSVNANTPCGVTLIINVVLLSYFKLAAVKD